MRVFWKIGNKEGDKTEKIEEELTIKQQAEEILRIAKKYGVEQNFLFTTTFSRYSVQLNILNELKNSFENDGTLVTKEYVKGRENTYTHPAIGEYNKTTTAANQTVSTLLKIITTLRKNGGEEGGEDDPLLQALCGVYN